ncbi:hypothetical protein ACWEGE_01705 [Amycolatopsis sp. NPDC004747]
MIDDRNAARTGPTAEDIGKAERAIRMAAHAAAALGVPGLFHPGLDEAGMAAIWGPMVTTVARHCGAKLSAATAGKFVTMALSSVATFSVTSKVLSWGIMALLLTMPAVAVPAAAALNASLNALFTVRLGGECIRRFSDPRFNGDDLRRLGRLLVTVPSWSELGEIKRLLAG